MIFHDYLSIWAATALILATPLLHTVFWIDIFLIPTYLYAVFASFIPGHIGISYPTLKIQVTTQGHQHLYIALCFLFALLIKSSIKTESLKKFLAWFGIVNLINTFIFKFINFGSGGLEIANKTDIGSIFIPNTAMNASLNIVLLPFMLYRFQSSWLLIAALVIGLAITAKSSTAVFTLFCILLSTTYKFPFPKKLISGLFLLDAFLVFGKKYIDHFFTDGGRFGFYKLMFMDFKIKDWIIGKSPSSFQEWGAAIQYVNDYRMQHGVYIWMHSDPLQCIWEMGFAGLFLASISCFFLLRKSEETVFFSLVAFIASSVFYYPWHTPVPLFVFFLLCKLTYNYVKMFSKSPNGSGGS